MAKRFITILLVPDEGTRMKRLIVPVAYLKALAGVAIAIVTLFVVFMGGFLYYRHKNVNFEAMRQENQRYRQEIETIRSKVASVETYLERVKRFDQKIRLITNLEDPERHIALGPLEPSEGGARPTDQMDELDGAPKSQQAAISPEFRPPQFDADEEQPQADSQDLSALHGKLEGIESSASEREQSLMTLENRLRDMGSVLRATPAVWPSYGWVTSNFGFRISPFSGERTMHEGLDIAASPGTPVKTPADGVITYVGTDGGYGKSIVINHGYGTVTRYGHLSEIFVKLGENVKRGDRIAAIGNTGRSTGPHLHYEVVVNGIPRDPKKYILN